MGGVGGVYMDQLRKYYQGVCYNIISATRGFGVSNFQKKALYKY